MLKAAKLDWTVSKLPNYVKRGAREISTGTYAIVRDDNDRILSPNVGPAWEEVDNAKCFEFFNDFVKSGNAEMHTAGSLRGGQIIWGLAKIKDKFQVFGGDEIEGYVFLSASHLYGKVTTTDFTPIRVVCNNTLMMALESSSQYSVSINHRTKFDPEVVKMMMGIASFQLAEYREACIDLGGASYTGKEVRDYFAEIFPLKGADENTSAISKTAETCLQVLEIQPGTEYASGTWWQAYNAVTYVADHVLGRSADSRLFNSWLGGVRQKKIKAFNLARSKAIA